MKHTSRIFAIILTLAMLLTVTAFAAWPVYGGNNQHTGIVATSAPTDEFASSEDDAETYNMHVTEIDLQNPKTGWDGVDNVPVMQTVGSGNSAVTYAYVLYDGHSAGCTLTKVNCNAGEIVWEKQLESTSGFQLSTPLLVQGSNADSEADDAIYAASNGGNVYKISGLESTTADGVNAELLYTVSAGQINTPITYNNGYIYFGTWIGNGTIEGSTAPGCYYQLNLSNTSDVQTVSSIKRGFYWSGAVVVGDYIYFGGDDGYLFYRPVGENFGTTATTGTNVKLNGNDTGNVRSTIATDGTYLYFTSQSKYLWCYKPAADGTPEYQWNVGLSGTSTSTPTVVNDGTTTSIYTGFYSGFNAGGVEVTTYTNGNTPTTATTLVTGFPVQSSILYYNGYIYFNTNSSSGAGYCYEVDGTTASEIWATDADTYALGGMAIDNGYAVFGNDYNHLYIVQ